MIEEIREVLRQCDEGLIPMGEAMVKMAQITVQHADEIAEAINESSKG